MRLVRHLESCSSVYSVAKDLESKALALMVVEEYQGVRDCLHGNWEGMREVDIHIGSTGSLPQISAPDLFSPPTPKGPSGPLLFLPANFQGPFPHWKIMNTIFPETP